MNQSGAAKLPHSDSSQQLPIPKNWHQKRCVKQCADVSNNVLEKLDF
jgi:hypothetical protein